VPLAALYRREPRLGPGAGAAPQMPGESIPLTYLRLARSRLSRPLPL